VLPQGRRSVDQRRASQDEAETRIKEIAMAKKKKAAKGKKPKAAKKGAKGAY
jgi:hypothetical protein